MKSKGEFESLPNWNGRKGRRRTGTDAGLKERQQGGIIVDSRILRSLKIFDSCLGGRRRMKYVFGPYGVHAGCHSQPQCPSLPG